jgi:hypothetical protein
MESGINPEPNPRHCFSIELCFSIYNHILDTQKFKPVFLIRVGLNADPYPIIYLSADSDPALDPVFVTTLEVMILHFFLPFLKF